MRIVFMGTPDFAATALRRLLGSGQEVAAVYTQPDRPQGRRFVLTAPPVKELALQHGVAVFQPASLKDAQVQAQLSDLSPDIIVVAAYGKILPRAVLDIPRRGCVNVHASLLPRYRGAAPIQRAVMDGEQITGVTIMQMDEGLDTGAILLARSLAIGPDETAGQLFGRMARLGAEALLEALSSLDALTPTPQDEALATWAPPLKKEEGLIDWSRPVQTVYARLRGVTPWPGAYTLLDGRRLKIHTARPSQTPGAPGALLDSRRPTVGCASGSLELVSVQLEGAKILSGEEFLRGRRLMPGHLFGQ